MEPVLKWAGGKRQLLKELEQVIHKEDLEGHTYFEPFVGGGALLLKLMPKKAVINDINKELVILYSVIRDNPDELIAKLEEFKAGYPDNYENIRALDRELDFTEMSHIVRAARLIYLNKTCYNGLYRVNSQGYFNVPKGRYRNPNIVNQSRIKKLSDYLRNNQIEITNLDFEEAVKTAKSGDFVYFDPPYDYEAAGFTTYSSDGFTKKDLERLKITCDKLIEKGCNVTVSNNATQYVKGLFKDTYYTITEVPANRFINCDGTKRTHVMEVIINGRKN